MVFPLVAWAASVAAIEVSPERITVRGHLRSRTAAMTDLLRVDARRSPWRYMAAAQPAPYIIDLWLRDYRHWHLQYVEADAGDRLLARLHGYQKSIWILPPA
jgi:hypothetical protein